MRRIRRVLDKKSREHGGTEGTYLRECFLNWDADCSGTIDSTEFRKAIRSLGLDLSQADASYLVGYYGGVESAYTSIQQNEMTYDLLIEDVVNASTHFLQPQPAIPQSARPDGPFPPVLRRFIKKVRQKLFQYIAGKGENERRGAPRVDVLGWLPFVAGTRVHLTMKWVVSFSIFERPRRSAQVAHLPHQHLCLVGLCLSFGGPRWKDGDLRSFIVDECRYKVYYE